MKKQERQAHIKRLIEAEVIERQSDFVTRLTEQKIPVTQATISRDIKEMQLVKVPMADGRYRYSLPVAKQLSPLDKLRRTLLGAFRSIDVMDRFIAMNLAPGTAPAVGHLIEQLEDSRVFATIVDDATILILCRGEAAATQLAEMLEGLVD